MLNLSMGIKLKSNAIRHTKRTRKIQQAIQMATREDSGRACAVVTKSKERLT